METLKLRPGGLYLLLVGVAAFIALFEYSGMVEHGGLLVTVVFWTGLVQGCLAVIAVTELVDARWIASLKNELAAVHPLLLLLILLYLLLWPQADLYPWTKAPGAWLNEPFFFGRGLLFLFLSWAAGGLLIRRSLRGDRERKKYAVIYLFVFVVSQCLVAYDWVMSLEYPWYSTLFGAYFFIEALYAGVAMSGLVFFFFYRGKAAEEPIVARRHLRDIASLMFGFSILWTGLFFAQFLLLWYGNLPEEVGFIAERISTPFWQGLAWFFLAAGFLVPFTVLISRRAKSSPGIVALVAMAVLLGQLAERLLYVLPAAPLHLGVIVLESSLLFFLWLLAINSWDLLHPSATESGRVVP